MTNILEKIITHKRTEVRLRKEETGISVLEKSANFSRPVFSLKSSLTDKNTTGIIAEFKKRSPSKGIIHADADVVKITKAYTEFGASGISVLTDEQFFGGKNADLEAARFNNIPILRKDFIIDEYQVVEAKSIGADVILLIAACLTTDEVKRLASVAKNLGLEVLLELHAEEELGHIGDEIDMVGINNRNLKTFEVNIERSLRMAEKIPADTIKIAESGIDSVENIVLFRENGFKGFLVGEHFMKQPDPAIAFADFVNTLQNSLKGG